MGSRHLRGAGLLPVTVKRKQQRMRWRHYLGIVVCLDRQSTKIKEVLWAMARETRPKDYPKLKNYQPTRFMIPTSHYDKKKADRAVSFIENLCHTKGKWAGKRFWLLPWQEQLIRDIFGIVKPDGNRQFRTAFVEICKKVGKSELAAAIALYLLYADNEPSAEVYGVAADRQQASIVF